MMFEWIGTTIYQKRGFVITVGPTGIDIASTLGTNASIVRLDEFQTRDLLSALDKYRAEFPGMMDLEGPAEP